MSSPVPPKEVPWLHSIIMIYAGTRFITAFRGILKKMRVPAKCFALRNDRPHATVRFKRKGVSLPQDSTLVTKGGRRATFRLAEQCEPKAPIRIRTGSAGIPGPYSHHPPCFQVSNPRFLSPYMGGW